MEQRRELSFSLSPCLMQAEPFGLQLSPSVAGWLEHSAHFSSSSATTGATWPQSPFVVSASAYQLDALSPSVSSAAVSEATTAAPSSPQSLLSPLSPSSPLSGLSTHTPAAPQPSRSASVSPAASLVSSFSPANEKQSRAVQAEPASPSVVTLVQHRRADTERRHREKAAIRRLEELAGAEESCHLPAAAATATTADPSSVRQKRKRRKLSVLQASAARIERLEALLHASELTNRMSEARMQRMSEEISGIVTRERRNIQWLVASNVLRGAGLLGDHFASTLMDCRTGLLLDANSTFFATTGFTPGGVLQRLLDRVGSVSQTEQYEYPLVRARRSVHYGNHSGGGSAQWVALQPCRQYPRTMHLLQEMLTGQRDNFRAPFRCRWADGWAYEIQGNFWLWWMWSGWRRRMVAGGGGR